MQIHELPAGSPASGVQFAGDTGTQTQKIDYDALADSILNKLTTKTFDIKSESQTIIAALNALGDASKQGVANNLVTTAAGLVLDARQGKALDDKITSLNSSLESIISKVQWKLAGSASGDSSVTWPENAAELLISAYVASARVLANAIYIPGQTSGGAVLGVFGYSAGNTDYGIVNLNINATNRTVAIRNFIYGGTNYTSQASLTVRYRTI